MSASVHKSSAPITRRQALAGLGAIIAAQHAPAALINLRGSMMVNRGGAWVNPYVTDGLIAMWDGEWNAGGGVHDANATVWADLAGGGLLAYATEHAYYESQNITFTDDAAVFNGSNSQLVGPAIDIADMSGLHMAICGTITAPYLGWGYYGSVPLRPVLSSLDGPYWSIITRYGISARASRTATTGTLAYDWPFDAGATLYLGSSGIASTSYYNGSATTTSQRFRIMSYGDAGTGAAVWGAGNIHNVRVYNRALTAAEIAANYAVDAARFNLATT